MAPGKLSSTIPGQLVKEEEEQLNKQFLLIAMASSTGSFLVSLMWAGFVTCSIDEVQRVTRHRIPDPVAKMMAAFVVTGTVLGVMCGLYRWERRVGEKEQNT
jgi:hypothetical protein